MPNVQHLRVLGGASIEVETGALTGRAVQRSRLALLAVLAAARAACAQRPGVSRERLVALLWPSADADSGRRYLSDSVYRINRALGGGDDVISTAGDELRLDVTRLPSDLVEFHDALSRGDHAQAVEVYGGPFLDGFFVPDALELEQWVESERACLSTEYAGALEALGDAAHRQGNAAEAIAWFRKLAAHDPYNARVALRLMEALRDAGDRVGAIQHARVHATRIQGELELDADPAVAALAERLRAEPLEQKTLRRSA